jgi:hypothetical protein
MTADSPPLSLWSARVGPVREAQPALAGTRERWGQYREGNISANGRGTAQTCVQSGTVAWPLAILACKFSLHP